MAGFQVNQCCQCGKFRSTSANHRFRRPKCTPSSAPRVYGSRGRNTAAGWIRVLHHYIYCISVWILKMHNKCRGLCLVIPFIVHGVGQVLARPSPGSGSPFMTHNVTHRWYHRCSLALHRWYHQCRAKYIDGTIDVEPRYINGTIDVTWLYIDGTIDIAHLCNKLFLHMYNAHM